MTYLLLNLCWNERESLINMARTEQMILHLLKTLIHVNNDLIIRQAWILPEKHANTRCFGNTLGFHLLTTLVNMN